MVNRLVYGRCGVRLGDSHRPFRALEERTVVLVQIDTHFVGIVVVEWVVRGLLVLVRLSSAEFRVRVLQSWRGQSVNRQARRPATLYREDVESALALRLRLSA